MSLRQRLFTMLLVAGLALAASLVGTVRLLARSAAAREASATAASARVVTTLARRLEEGFPIAQVGPVLEDLSRLLEEGSVGLCSIDGRMIAQQTTAESLHEPPGPRPRRGTVDTDPFAEDDPGPPFEQGGMLPLDRDSVEAACMKADATPATTRVVAPRDVLFVTTVRAQQGTVVFALVRQPRIAEATSPVSLAWLAASALTLAILLALAGHGAWVLRSSTASLRASVDALEKDLRAPVPAPKALELAEVARHLRTMAGTLADAQERERKLTRDVEEQRRLAGLGRVVAGVAHEVRNPLAGLKLRLDSMALRQLDGRTRSDVEKCLLEIARLDRLVRTLLLASKKRAVERAEIDAGTLLTERIALAAPLADARQVRVEHTGTATLAGEREGLAGVFDNLLRNAIEASYEGGSVEVRIAEEPAGARIEVLDAGPGIEPERVAELFEPFFTTKGNGTGLGLVLARGTVEAHGGTIEYERRDARTVFSVWLPDAARADT